MKKLKIENLPEFLRENGLFCLWRLEEVNGRPSKVPYSPHGGHARANDPSTFAPFDVVAPMQSGYSGLGLGIFGNICAIDVDHCIDEDGQYSEMALDIIGMMDSYTEISPSGTGIRILFTATGFTYDKQTYYINNQKRGLEVYVAGATNKYVTVTGDVVAPARGLEERGDALMAVLEKYMRRTVSLAPSKPTAVPACLPDAKVLEKAAAAKNGDKFSRLWRGELTGYESQSEADLALCNLLAFWCGKDANQIDRLFRQSGLMRDKWDRPQSGSTYGAITIEHAVTACRSTYTGMVAATTSSIGALASMQPDTNYKWSDIGNGRLFADVFKNVARYVADRGKWFVYDGARWQSDAGDLYTMELCKRLADELMVYALSLADERQKQNYIDYVNQWQRRSFRETILKDAASVHPIKYAEFDRDPMLFNCLNGTLNLATGEFYDHRAGDMLTQISGVNYDPDAKSERWLRFIVEVMQDKNDNAQYLQKALGYALAGSTAHECFFILYGPTSRNGKGTTMETYMRMLGDYGKAARPETIAQKQSGSNGPSEDLARLAGARFVNISEPDKHLTINAALVKTLTGSDTITTRYLHENSFEYRPQFKLFINTNYLPSVSDMTLFSSGRVRVIRFDRHFEEHERDPRLKAELATPENLSGILNWCIEGWRLIEQDGFEVPADILAATDEYRQTNDKIGLFIGDELDDASGAEVRTDDVYSRYKVWCGLNGCRAEGKSKFKTAMASRATIARKRPKANPSGNPQSLITGYRLRKGTDAEKVQLNDSY